jgi:hypothetical protein
MCLLVLKNINSSEFFRKNINLFSEIACQLKDYLFIYLCTISYTFMYIPILLFWKEMTFRKLAKTILNNSFEYLFDSELSN